MSSTPTFVLMIGDDQYENFKEDIIPPFCVLAYDEMHAIPFHRLGERPNIWGEPNEKVFNYKGYHMAGRALATRSAARGHRHVLRLQASAR